MIQSLYHLVPVDITCNNCGHAGMHMFYQIHDIPVHSCILLDSRDEALAFPRGDLRMGYCPKCGFIQNTLFNQKHNAYCTAYEETQGFSQVFSKYARDLAWRMIRRYGLYNKRILEIGCGKGEFIIQMCEMGPNKGIGIDPAYVPGRIETEVADQIQFIQDLYSEQYAHLPADFVCCRHTLEHIEPTLDFVSMVRRSIGDRQDVTVYFDVPDVRRVLAENAFWDIYYEHCSYFSIGSLGRVFRAAGFEILDLHREYDDQYLSIETRPSQRSTTMEILPQENDLDEMNYYIDSFMKTIHRTTNEWRSRLEELHEQGCKTVLWGSGSKATAFLTTLGISDEVGYVVDINPYRQGKYQAGTGHQIISPKDLCAYQPDMIIAMNPVYCEEIQNTLNELHIDTELVAVTDTKREHTHV
jgi:SAM-dependent methyltransferase